MPDLLAADIDRQIHLLIRNLVEIKDTSGEFLLRLPDGRVIDTKGWNDWEWTHGIGLYGILKYYQQTNDARCREIMLHWFRDRFAAGTPTKNINTVAPFLTLAYLHEESPNPSWLPYLDEWAEWLMDGLPRTEENGFQHIVFNSVNDQQMWDDTLMMSVLPLAKIGKLLGRPQYVEEARRQFMLHIKYLVDRKTGLWFHGWTFDGRHNFADALWARGNCWVTIAIPEFIELLGLKPGDGLREFLLETHLQQIRTRLGQREVGLHEQGEAPAFETLEHPALPERARAVEALRLHARRHLPQLGRATRPRQARVPHVVVEIELVVIDPDGMILERDAAQLATVVG